ncbi:MAG: hypothetical protein DRP71_14495 [Verrucomicrobia bacterium]|nr:MAG: hypothetical protein DRP71_14495 [Verrucomicrobiota bacterium]
MVTIDGEFENASLGLVTRYSDTWFQIGLRPDTAYWTHFRVRGCRGKEITFTLTYTERMHTNRWGTVESTNPERPDDRCRNPYLSYDGHTWQHFDHARRYVTVPHTVCFRHRFEEDEAFVCYTIPYTYGDLNRFIDGIRDHPWITIETLAQTTDGHDLPMISVAKNREATELIGLICREDSDEPTSNFALEGLIGRLMEGGGEIEALLDRCQFRIVPMVAIDAVVMGSPYGGPWDVMARRWLDDPTLPEIAAIKDQVRGWMGSHRVRLLGKLHGGQTFDNPPVWDFRVFDHALRKLIPKDLPAELDPIWNPFLRDAVPWVRELTIFETHLQQEYDFWNFFSTHTNGKDPDNLKAQGRRFADLLARFVLGA